MCVPLVGIWLVKYRYDNVFWLYLAVKCFSTLYSYSWDLYMDWGMLRSRDLKCYGLREKTTYPKCFYYFAAVSNLFLRFFWIIFIWQSYNILDSEYQDL